MAVNRILDSQGSHILGNINANGHVWLINPNGLFFGKNAQVNVGGLVASALDTANPLGFPFFNYRFTGNSTATVENQGVINAGFDSTEEAGTKHGGYVALVGHHVKNTGSISTAERGTVALTAGSNIQLKLSGNSLISLSVDQNQLNAMAVNGGVMQADGGQLVLSAGAANSALASVVNNTGVMQARTTTISKGRIVLSSAAKDGQLHLSGTLNASGGDLGEGGTVHTQASVIKVSDSTLVDTRSTAQSWGTWSLVQNNAAQNTADSKLSSMISGTALGEALNHSNVSLFTDKDLQIDTPVAWNAPSKLSLVAHENIAIDAAMNAANANGQLSLAYGQASTNGTVAGVKSAYSVKAPVSLMEGNNFSTQLGSSGEVKNFYVITRLGDQGSRSGKDLQGINGNLGGNFVLGADIDASSTARWNNGLGFKPIGNGGASSNFSGTFDGLGHSVTGLTINRPTADNIGLFGSARNATIKNITVSGVSMLGQYSVGGLIGTTSYSTIDNAHTSGRVTGNANAGGLIGSSLSATVINSDSTADVFGSDSNGAIGGLIGGMYAGSVSNSHTSGRVQGLTTVGGLVGNASNATVSNSYSLSEVVGVNSGSGIGAKAGGWR
jgi:large exoprotein involved in heme utilization and adhesion